MNFEGSITIKGKNCLQGIHQGETKGFLDLVFRSGHEEFILSFDRACLETVVKMVTPCLLGEESARNPNDADGGFTPNLSLFLHGKKVSIHGEWDDSELGNESIDPYLCISSGKGSVGFTLNAPQAEEFGKRCIQIIEAQEALDKAREKMGEIVKGESIPSPKVA